MSDFLHHECGIVYIRLRKPLQHYINRYGTPLYGFNLLDALMHKQRNRGHDGVGIGCCKINVPHGTRYLFQERSVKRTGLSRIFDKNQRRFSELAEGEMDPNSAESVKKHFEFGGENLVGHLRYSTFGGSAQIFCHPQLRESTWATKSLMMLGNFTMTNVEALNQRMIDRGQHPFQDTDTQVIIEDVGFHLEEQHDELYHRYRDQGIPGAEIPKLISDDLDVVSILRTCVAGWDGGYAMVGLIGNGDGFVLRDPNRIRPCFYYEDEEVIAFASERPPLMTIFEASVDEVQELPPGHVASVTHQGNFEIVQIAEPRRVSPCSFERIYFSRGNDPDIHAERKALGAALVPQIVEAAGDKWDDVVFSFIPNTAETGYLGMMDELRRRRRQAVKDEIKAAAAAGELTDAFLDEVIMNGWPRGEKVANKDEQNRTFISKEQGRSQQVSIAYDITYGVVEPKDTLIALDDSIVRGTTLREAIVRMLARANPKRIIILSTAPQIRYPDCYGIDMSEFGKFLAFKAAVSLLKSREASAVLDQVYEACRAEVNKPVSKASNCVKAIYEPFSPEELAEEMARIVRPADMDWDGELLLIFQTIENLHTAIPTHNGDWYFTGNYPTPGGNDVANRSYLDYYEGLSRRATGGDKS